MKNWRWIKKILPYKTKIIFSFGAIVWSLFFIFIFFNFLDLTGFNFWITQKFFDYIDQDIKNSQVAGEYNVRIAADGTNFNPSFPKTMRQGAEFPQSKRTSSDFSDGATPLIWSKYDMVAFSGSRIGDSYGQEFAKEIKQYNSNAVVLAFPNSLLNMPASAPDNYRGTGSYFSYRADGTRNNAYGGLANFTKQAAGPYTITNGNDGFYDNLQASDLQYFDGVFYPDGRSGFSPSDLCSGSRYTNLDFDENGIKDVDEYGNDCSKDNVTEINTRWRFGYDARINQEHLAGGQISGRPWKVVINDGGPPIGDTVAPDTFKSLVDGFMFENAPSEWIKLKDILIDWDVNGKKPSFVNWVDTVGRRNKNWMKDGQNNFQKMRFDLTTTMLGDAYYGLCIGEGNMICFWYDEFNIDLGQPKPNGRHEISSKCTKLCPWGDCPNWCPYVRFFDNGAILVNPTGADLPINEGDIAGFEGYDPPYYHFIGGQDPAVNNGQQFGSVILKSSVVDPSAESKKLASGDGIILVKQQNYAAVSEILVGNGRHDDTSPGSKPVTLTGNWSREWGARDENGQGNPYYTQFLANWLPNVKVCQNSWNDCSRDADCAAGELCVLPQDATNGVAINDGYPMMYTNGAGATATFRPTVGVEGDYEIYEWHGWRGNAADSYTEVASVPVEIKSANGVENTTINQQINYCQWNKIGTKYHFQAGTDGYVKFTHPGGSEYLIADVVKFVYTGNAVITPPPPAQTLKADFNCDGVVDIKDFGILLSHWEKTEPPANLEHYANGHCAGTETPTKNLNLADCQATPLSINGTDFGVLLPCWGTPDPNISPVCYGNVCSGSSYTPVCGNSIHDTGEACDPTANPSGAPINSTCKSDCSDFECNLGYTKSGNACVPASGCTPNLTNQYSKGVIEIIDPAKLPPVVGESYCDAQFGTLVKRITGDSTIDGRGGSLNNGEITHWNIDGSLFYARRLDGTHLFDANGADLGRIHDALPEWDIRWSSDPNFVYKVVADRNRIEYCNIRTQACSPKKTFDKYESVAWGEEGDLSDDRAKASLAGYYSTAGEARAEIFVYDFLADIIYAPARYWQQADFDDGSNGVDYHTISAGGNYVVVSWHKGGQEMPKYGIELYRTDMSFIKQLNAGKLHFDTGYDTDGNEVIFTRAGNYYAVNHPLPGVRGIYDLIKIRLDNNPNNIASLLLNVNPSSGDSLVFAAPNWQKKNYQFVYVSTFEDTPVNLINPTEWHEYWFEIIEVPTNGSQSVRRLLHNRSPVLSGMSNMAAQPDFSINGAGTKLFFKSDMNQNGTDLYLVDIVPR